MKPKQTWEQGLWEIYRQRQRPSLCTFTDYQRAAQIVRRARFLAESGLLAAKSDTILPSAAPPPVQVEHRLFALFAD